MWKNVYNQSRAKDILKRIYNSGSIAHAYIFYGPEGAGKDALALELAKLINCDNPSDNGSCDECHSCSSFKRLNSQYLQFIIPMPAAKKEAAEDSTSASDELSEKEFEEYQELLQEKLNDPYKKLKLTNANNIRISSIRAIKNSAYFTSGNKTKVFIISNADAMNMQSANALLKVLEEPPPRCLLILTTARLSSLPATIAGRCQPLKLSLLSKEDIKDYLNSNYDLSKTDIDLISSLANGSISKAIETAETFSSDIREQVLTLLGSIITGKTLTAGGITDKILSLKNKDKLKQFLYLMQVWFADLDRYKAGNFDTLVNSDKADRMKVFTGKFDSDNYEIICRIEDSIKDIDANLYPEIILNNLYSVIKNNVFSRAKTEV